jgi:hypothetical protein
MKSVFGRPQRSFARAVVVVGFLFTSGVTLAATSAQASTWDAIAVDDDTTTKGGDAGFGVGTGGSRAEAEGEALKTCRESGNHGCQVEVSYRDMCGAYASSRKYAGHGVGPTKEAAKRAALDSCGDDACKIVVSDCAED